MRNKTKIIIITVVAVALVALAVWYFGFHKKKAEDTDETSGKTDNESLSDVFLKSGSPDRLSSVPETFVDSIYRTDYEVAPAAAYRLNSDLMSQLAAQTVKNQNGFLVNTNKTGR